MQESDSEGFLEKPARASEGNTERRLKSSYFSTHRLSILSSLIVGLLWLAPAIFLLYLAFAQWIIGASAWCPGGSCKGLMAQYNNTNPENVLKKEDLQGRDLLGGLQYLSKIMEVWFVFVAASLVWAVASIVARRPGGIPLGYLFAHVEFSDLRALISSSMLSAGVKNRSSARRLRWGFSKYTWFLLFVIAMCLLSNFMGPSLAVLILPTLAYTPTELIPQQRFKNFLSTNPPTNLFGCNSTDLQNGLYECSYDGPGQSFDAQIADAVFSDSQGNPEYAANVVISEEGLQFTVNSTNSWLSPLWVPLRQVLDDLNYSLMDINRIIEAYLRNGTQPPDAFNSLELYLQRNAPIMGFQGAGNISTMSTTIVDETRQIRCFNLLHHNLTQCSPVGPGWENGSSVYTFSVEDPDRPATSLVTTDVYNSSKLWCLPSSFSEFSPSGCLPNGTLTATDCTFDNFPTIPCGSGLSNFSSSSARLIWESRIPNGPLPNARYIASGQWVYTNATYQFDLSPLSNFADLVTIPDLPVNGQGLPPINVDPTWILAGLSTSNGSTIPYNRSIASLYVNATLQLQQDWLEDWQVDGNNLPEQQSYFDIVKWLGPIELAIGHTTSLINYTFTSYSNASTIMTSAPGYSWDDLQRTQNADSNPIIYTTFQRRVWTYGVQDRRTAVLGIVVVILGCVVVILRTVVVLYSGSNMKEPLELVVAALEHQPDGDFEGVKRSETHLARVRYRILEEGEEIEFVKQADTR